MESREQGLGIRGWGFGKVVGLGLLVVFSTAAYASHPNGENSGTGLRITVRIQDYAQVPQKILAEAEREATAMLEDTGVDFMWAHCSVGALASDPVCMQPFRATDLALRILPPLTGAQLPLSGDSFGFAATSTDRRPSFLASVLYHRVEALSDSLGYSRAATLGYVLAHEIGHLLLGTNSHSPFGIMRARLTREDLLRPLRFTSAQAGLIRADVRARPEAAALRETMPEPSAELHESASHR
jgi:hypothetical protein